jgi:predicted adenine nucleotide alpha hydrolase (AANH) superfamily ATPase
MVVESVRLPGMRTLTYWTYNWRKAGGSQRMIEISKRENFYQQEYCGCVYSLRDTNKWRVSQGRKKVNIGETYYGVNNRVLNC